MNYEDLIEKEIQFIRKIPINQVERLIKLLSVRFSTSKIATCGMGKAGQIAHTLATTLSSTGSPSFFIHPAEAQHGDLGMIGSLDTVIVISNSGKTKEVIEFIHLCRNLYKGLSIYGILGEPNSEIASLCNYSIVYGPVKEICPLELTPTTSTTCMSIICDLIVVGLMNEINFTKTQYAKLHHGGYNGIKSKEV